MSYHPDAKQASAFSVPAEVRCEGGKRREEENEGGRRRLEKEKRGWI